jgi:hypothetical protein
MQINKIEGLQLIPINDKKIPLVKNWQNSTEAHNFDNAYGVGLVCGAISGNVEGLDFDLKYDLTGDLFDRYKRAVKKINPDILPKLVVQKTTSGGFHCLYKCSVIEGNKKLAQRYATEEEQLLGDKIKVLIETRGEGGYLAIYPTPGYELIYGSFDNIQEITPEEREVLISTAIEFNEVIKEFKPIVKPTKVGKGTSPFEDYDDRGDVISLLQSHGWKVIEQTSSKTIFLRPGQTTASHSGNFNHDNRWFSVFSTSTIFNAQEGYRPYAVYAMLECNGDFSEASKKLYDEGYGERRELQREEKVPSKIDTLGENKFVVKRSEYQHYIKQVIDGTLQLGTTYGFPSLDKNLVFNEGYLNIWNGYDNIGKTTVLWYFKVLQSLLQGRKHIIYSAENNSFGGTQRKLMEFYLCKKLNDMKEDELAAAYQFVDDHFSIIKNNDIYNYKDVLNIIELCNSERHHDTALIDPYNSLKIDLSSKSKLSTHDYHYEAMSEMQVFAMKHKTTIDLNAHAVTSALRNNGDKAPSKGDTEQGTKMSAKAMDFITLHRVTNHPTDWMWTEIYARKIKDTDLGGQVTPSDKPFKMKMVNKVGFEDEFGYNPVLAFHNKESYNPPVAIQENLSFLDEKPIRKLVIKDEEEEEDPW